MKSIYIVVLLSIIISSCQKEIDLNITPKTIDSLNAVLPKQVILTDNTVTPSTIIYSIKYDTTNYRIDLYLDDTTNSNPYDVLAVSYQYNTSGYLLSYKIFDLGNISYTINRNGDNKVAWIAHEDNDIDLKDTTFFTYQTINTGTKITTVVKSYYPAWPVSIDTLLYSYSTDLKLMQVQGYGAISTYEYNINNSIKKITTTGDNFSNETNFFYTSGIPDEKEDVVCKVFLGKDYYLQNIRDLYALASFRDAGYKIVSATDPYYPTRMQDITNDYGQIETEERSWQYELNNKKLRHKIFGSFDGQQETTAEFKY